jgi:hypothetical protein
MTANPKPKMNVHVQLTIDELKARVIDLQDMIQRLEFWGRDRSLVATATAISGPDPVGPPEVLVETRPRQLPAKHAKSAKGKGRKADMAGTAIDAIKSLGEPFGAAELAKLIGGSRSAASSLMWRLMKKGAIRKVAFGAYVRAEGKHAVVIPPTKPARNGGRLAIPGLDELDDQQKLDKAEKDLVSAKDDGNHMMVKILTDKISTLRRRLGAEHAAAA